VGRRDAEREEDEEARRGRRVGAALGSHEIWGCWAE
jgi:hypothetical protein